LNFSLIYFLNTINLKHTKPNEYKIFRFNKSNLLFPTRRIQPKQRQSRVSQHRFDEIGRKIWYAIKIYLFAPDFQQHQQSQKLVSQVDGKKQLRGQILLLLLHEKFPF